MNRDEIIKRLMGNDTTVLSFPDRGPWGDQKYRGNCSGYIQAFLIWKYQVEKFAELFAGSGTGYDVCMDMGVPYFGADLNPNPVRPGIACVDAFADEVPEEFSTADFVFMHPPYGKEINIPYAGNMYQDATGELSKKDLGQMSWKEFMKTLNCIVMKYFAAMESGGRMGILMGDVRRNGHLYCMMNDIVKPGELEQVIIKMQHNCVSNGRSYSHKKFVPLVHEYILVLKKIAPYMLDFIIPQKKKLDIRDSKCATWRDVVFATLQKLGGKAKLEDIYQEVGGHQKAKANPHWKEKIRQTLQMYQSFRPVERGVWALSV